MSTPITFIMIDTPTYREVIEACDYQEIALNNYIENGYTEPVEYGTDTEECFTISKMDSVKYSLLGNYEDVYNYMKNDGLETLSFISINHTKLCALCGFLNRITEYE